MNIEANSFVDITDVVCPITFVKTKVALEEIGKGQILEIKLNSGEPIANVPRSLKDEGHKIIKVINGNDDTYTLYVEKGGLE
jgi:TusA-related sulfurtransferase